MKLTKFKKRVLIVAGTVVGLVALFLIIVFIPIENTNIDITETNKVVEKENSDLDGLSVDELKKIITDLRLENQELKDEIEKYASSEEDEAEEIMEPEATDNNTNSKTDVNTGTNYNNHSVSTKPVKDTFVSKEETQDTKENEKELSAEETPVKEDNGTEESEAVETEAADENTSTESNSDAVQESETSETPSEAPAE